jgi:hypothetical protein
MQHAVALRTHAATLETRTQLGHRLRERERQAGLRERACPRGGGDVDYLRGFPSALPNAVAISRGE